MKEGSVILNVVSVEKILKNKKPCNNSSLDDLGHNFDFGKSRLDVQDSESSGSVVLVPEGKTII